MKILVFEWLVGGGVAGEAPMLFDDPFLVQGAEMYGAILEDCLRLGMEVLSPVDPRHTQAVVNFDHLQGHDNFHITSIKEARELEPALQSLAKQADHIVFIAPESEGVLLRCAAWIDGFQTKLVCGPTHLIEVFSDKNATQQLLKSHGVAVAPGAALPPEILTDGGGKALSEFVSVTEQVTFPVVVKPADGAGGDNVILCHNMEQLESAVANLGNANGALRVERFIAGKSVSVSIVRNKCETRLLPGTEQRFSNDWSSENVSEDSPHRAGQLVGHFVESVYPLEADQQRRATALAAAVAQAIPAWRGYLGVDMVLADDGIDVVVELNPRLTMSYATIREETEFNLMAFLLSRTSVNGRSAAQF